MVFIYFSSGSFPRLLSKLVKIDSFQLELSYRMLLPSHCQPQFIWFHSFIAPAIDSFDGKISLWPSEIFIRFNRSALSFHKKKNMFSLFLGKTTVAVVQPFVKHSNLFCRLVLRSIATQFKRNFSKRMAADTFQIGIVREEISGLFFGFCWNNNRARQPDLL